MLSNLHTKTNENSAENAALALREPNFPAFFTHLAKVPSTQQQGNLIQQAIPVAQQQKSVAVLRTLAEKSEFIGKDYYSDFLGDIIKILLEFNQSDADDAAISLAVFYSANRGKNNTSLWLILCQAYEARKDIEKVEKLYRYLDNDHDKREIVSGILEHISLTDKSSHWFEWFANYLQVASVQYYSVNETFPDQAVKYLVEHESFLSLLPYVIRPLTHEIYTNFISQLFFKLLIAKQTTKVILLLEKLPPSLSWLAQVNDALSDETAFGVFAQDEFEYELDEIQHPIFSLVIAGFFSRQEQQPTGVIVEKFLQCLTKISTYKRDTFLLLFCTYCRQQQRDDIVIHLLKQDISRIPFKSMCLSLLPTTFATADDYRFIVEKLDHWPNDITIVDKIDEKKRNNKAYQLDCFYAVGETLNILLHIPRQMVYAEDARRKHLKTQEQVALKERLETLPDNSVSRNQNDYYMLISQIDAYLVDKMLAPAFVLIKKMPSSGYRDDFLKQIALLFLDRDQMSAVDAACKLLAHTSEQWKTWPQKVITTKYQKTLNWLLTGDFYELKIVIKYYVEKIFIQNERSVALEILFSSGLFGEGKLKLDDYYRLNSVPHYFNVADDDMDTDEDSDIISVTSGAEATLSAQSLEELIVSHFIVHYADSKKLSKKMADLKGRGIVGFEIAILFYHLRRQQWPRAVSLINLFASQENSGQVSYRLDYLEKLDLLRQRVICHFKDTTTLTLTTLNKIKQINDSDLRAYILYALLTKRDTAFSQVDTPLIQALVTFITQLPRDAHHYELLCAMFDKFPKPFTQPVFMGIQHILVHSAIAKNIKRNLYQQYMLLTLFKNPALVRESELEYWKTQEPFWHYVTTQVISIPEKNASRALVLLQYFMQHITEWKPLIHTAVHDIVAYCFTWMIKQCAQEDQALFEATLTLYAVMKDDYFLENKYHSCLQALVAKSSLSAPWGMGILQHLTQTQILSREIRLCVETVLNNSITTENETYIRQAFDFLLQRSIKGYDNSLTALYNAISILLKKGKIDMAQEFILSIVKSHPMNFIMRDQQDVLRELCDYWIRNNNISAIENYCDEIGKTLETQDENIQRQFKERKLHLMLYATQKLVENKEFILAHDVYHKNLTAVRLDHLKNILDNLIANNQLLFAKEIIDGKHASDPQIILNYRQHIVAQYDTHLVALIGNIYAERIKECYVQFVKILQHKANGNAPVASLQSQLVTALKNMLDKAFQDYYQRTFNRESPRVFGKMCNFPAPLNDFFKGKTPEAKLNAFFADFKINPVDPNLRQFLLSIQPSTNQNYQWLEQLRKMRNDETHAPSFLPETPIVNGQPIDMMTFLPQVLTGVEKILIKLFDPSRLDNDIEKLSLNNLLSLRQEALHVTAHALGLHAMLQPQNKQALTK
ncbi:MAG: hypothetical protein WC748_08775 [Legionellales bacterium]|jgi:hypothetical protein